MVVYIFPVAANGHSVSCVFGIKGLYVVKTTLFFFPFAYRYTPSQQGVAFNSGAKQRVIRMVEMQKDPMEPPRFKYVHNLGLGDNSIVLPLTGVVSS